MLLHATLNSLRPRQNGCHLADDSFICIFLNEKIWISIKISLKFIFKGPIDNILALIQIMAWRRSGDKPLSEQMMIILLTHICIYASVGFIELIELTKNNWASSERTKSIPIGMRKKYTGPLSITKYRERFKMNSSLYDDGEFDFEHGFPQSTMTQ